MANPSTKNPKEEEEIEELLEKPSELVQEFHEAAKNGDIEALKRLLGAGININSPDHKGDSALVNSCANDNIAVIKFLLENGADVNYINSKFLRTPLLIAAKNASKEAIEVLLKQGADVLAIDIRERNALLEAIHVKRSPEIILLLKSYLKDQKDFKESIELHNKYLLVKHSGHILGMSGSVKLKNSKVKTPLKIEYTGCVSNTSLDKLQQLLVSYTNKRSGGKESQDFITILEAMEVLVQHREGEGKVSDKDLLKRYQNDNLVFLYPGIPMHRMGLALYKKSGVYCNRGDGGELFEKGYTHIFKMPDSKVVTEALFDEVSSKSDQDVLKSIRDLMEGGEPKAGLPSKRQKFGTCSFVNIKATIEGVLYLFEKERLQNDKEAKYSSEKIETLARHYAETEYKRFTKFIRTEQVNTLLEGLKNAPINDKTFYLTILRDYVSTHYGDDVSFKARDILGKKSHQMDLNAAILKAVTETMGFDAAVKFLESTGRTDALIVGAVKLKHAGLIEALRELVPKQIEAEMKQCVEPKSPKKSLKSIRPS